MEPITVKLGVTVDIGNRQTLRGDCAGDVSDGTTLKALFTTLDSIVEGLQARTRAAIEGVPPEQEEVTKLLSELRALRDIEAGLQGRLKKIEEERDFYRHRFEEKEAAIAAAAPASPVETEEAEKPAEPVRPVTSRNPPVITPPTGTNLTGASSEKRGRERPKEDDTTRVKPLDVTPPVPPPHPAGTADRRPEAELTEVEKAARANVAAMASAPAGAPPGGEVTPKENAPPGSVAPGGKPEEKKGLDAHFDNVPQELVTNAGGDEVPCGRIVRVGEDGKNIYEYYCEVPGCGEKLSVQMRNISHRLTDHYLCRPHFDEAQKTGRIPAGVKRL